MKRSNKYQTRLQILAEVIVEVEAANEKEAKQKFKEIGNGYIDEVWIDTSEYQFKSFIKGERINLI